MGQETMKIVLAGECMVTRPFRRRRDPGFDAVLEILRSSDLTYAHLETNIGGLDEIGFPKSADWTGSYLLSEPKIAEDLAWAGIDVVSAASNHSFDFGASGILSTLAHCRRAGIGCAGIGPDLEAARAPVYHEMPYGRAALVSLSTGNKAYEVAGMKKGGIAARPGVNPMRVKTQFVVDAEAAQSLRSIGKQLGILRDGNKAGLPGLEAGEFRLAAPQDQSTRVANVFVEGEVFSTRNICEPNDLTGNVRSIEQAAEMADLVIAAHHFNISEGARGDAPPSFVRQIAHASIDAGADIYVGHGWHKTLGIEIYKGKPIIYGIGNFFAQSEFTSNVPYDSYEAWGHDVARLPELGPNLHPLHPGLDGPSMVWWSSAAIELVFDSNRTLNSFRLHPVDMGREVSSEANLTHPVGKGHKPLTDGVPRVASGQQAERIIGRINDLSLDLGTSISFDGAIGHVQL